VSFNAGDKVTYHPSKGGKFDAIVKADLTNLKRCDNVIIIRIDNDPFPVTVSPNQVTYRGENPKMATKVALKKEADSLGIEGWEDMDLASLKLAVAEANGDGSSIDVEVKSAKRRGRPAKAKANEDEAEAPKKPRGRPKGSTNGSTKAPAKTKPAAKKAATDGKGRGRPKGSTKTAENMELNGTPYRSGTNMEIITKRLMQGGKRSTIAKQLLKKIDFKPTKNKDIDPEIEMEKRILLTAHNLKGHGFTIVTEGRGTNGTISVLAPGNKAAAPEALPEEAPAKRTRKKAAAKS
jgi:hypothetical protein